MKTIKNLLIIIRQFYVLVILLSTTATLFLFQNCGSSFNTNIEMESTQNPAGVDDPPVVDVYKNVLAIDQGSGDCNINYAGEAHCKEGKIKLEGLPKISQIATNGMSGGCAIDESQNLICFKHDGIYVISEVQNSAVDGKFKSVKSSLMALCAQKNDNKLFCTKGYPVPMEFFEVTHENTIKEFSVYGAGICFIDNLEELYCSYGLIGTVDFHITKMTDKKYKKVVQDDTVAPIFCALNKVGDIDCYKFLYEGNKLIGAELTNSYKGLYPYKDFIFTSESYLQTLSFCATDTQDDLYCWGNNLKLFANPKSDALEITTPNLIFNSKTNGLKLNSSMACALKEDSQLICWSNFQKRITNLTPFESSEFANTIKYFAINEPGYSADAYKLDINGRLSCLRSIRWDKIYSPLKRDIEACSETITNGFVTSGNLKNVIKFIAKKYDDVWLCALRDDGKVTCWGSSSNYDDMVYRDYGVTSERQSSSITPYGEVKGLTNIIDIVEIDHGVCALKNTGEVFCWGGLPGSPNDYQLLIQPNPIKQEAITDAVKLIALPINSSIGLVFQNSKNEIFVYEHKYDGTKNLRQIPQHEALQDLFYYNDKIYGLTSDGRIIYWKYYGVEGDFANPNELAVNIEKVAVTESHFCVKTKDKKLMCMGYNWTGALTLGHNNGVLETEGLKESSLFKDIDDVFVWDRTTCVKQNGKTLCVGTKPFNVEK